MKPTTATPSGDRLGSSNEHSADAPRHTARRVWLTLHMFVGLSVGAIFAIQGLTGSSLVFRRSIDAWLNPHLLSVRITGAPASLKTVLSNVRSSLPAGAHLQHLEFPLNKEEVIRAVYGPAAASGRAIEVMVDPTTGSILGQRERDNHLTGLLYHFHRELFAGKTGETVIRRIRNRSSYLSDVRNLSVVASSWREESVFHASAGGKHASASLRSAQSHRYARLYSGVPDRLLRNLYGI